jgi:5-formyltetrahydrofolate cyclo-ligase
MAETLASRKDAVRRLALLARSRVRAGDIAPASHEAARLAMSLPEIQDASSVLAFASFGGEIPTDPLLELLLASGKTLMLPYVDTQDGAMRAAVIHSLDDLVPGFRGIRQPASRVPAAAAEVAVVPGVAFDERGTRLGYGGGFYDRYLEEIVPGVPVVGLCFDAQVMEDVPLEPHDRVVDVIVTEKRIIRVA